MNTATGPPWSQPPQFSNDMSAMGDPEFNSFVDLDLGDIDDLNIPIFDANGQNASGFVQDADTQHHHGARPDTNDALDQPATNIYHVNMHLAFEGRQDHSFGVPQGGHPPPTSQPIVPPTPNSAELQSEAANRFLSQLDPQTRSHWIEQQTYHQLRKSEPVRASTVPNKPIPMSGQASFTPLASPAVTPHDRRFHVQQEYSVQPGAYFSPLTSPALEGDLQPYQNNTSASPVATSSPIDPHVDMLGEAALPPPGTAGSRRRKRPNVTRSASSGSRVKQSPIAKPQQQRRKANLSSVVPSKSVQQIPHLSPTSPTAPQRPYSQTSSGTNSISPEPISEAIMGPPPKPASAQTSPAIHAESRSSSSSSLPAHAQVPATPASLLQTHHASRGSGILSSHELPISPNGTVMEELSLPEPAATRPALGRIDTALHDSNDGGDDTPRMSARKTPKLGPLSTPGSSTNLHSSGAQSRAASMANTVTSPTTSIVSPAGPHRKPDAKGGRGSKKRASISGSNTLVSPALRPKISPSIRPMMPGGGDGTHPMDEAMQTHFLTQRSNYQNLIEGTHVPGVSYPTELSTNLTSKRTSHKIAEQGRRNRINLALQEMQGLLPSRNGNGAQQNGNSSNAVVKFDEADDDDDDCATEGNGKSAAGGSSKNANGTGLAKQGGNSKAATVESAIEYIKYMQSQQRTWHEERSVWNQRIEEKDGEIEELRRRLDEMEQRFGESCGGETPLDSMMEAGGK